MEADEMGGRRWERRERTEVVVFLRCQNTQGNLIFDSDGKHSEASNDCLPSVPEEYTEIIRWRLKLVGEKADKHLASVGGGAGNPWPVGLLHQHAT